MEDSMPDATTPLFLHAITGDAFPATDPVGWCLKRARSPLLAAARERLLQCEGRTDRDRILNVVLRRCGLNLIEFLPGRVTVSYWTQRADLHPLLRNRGLMRPDVQVVLVRRKTGHIVVQPGDEFLRGERVVPSFPFALYRERWARRHERQPDDATAAPASGSSYSWEGVAEKRVPWVVLKAVWRQDAAACPNCDVPLLVRSFDRRRTGWLSGTGSWAFRVCLACGRSFTESLGPDPWDWLLARLGPGLLPAVWDGDYGPQNLRPRWPQRDLRDLNNLPPDLTTDELVRILQEAPSPRKP
jgi:hypothetical protein